jgi:hypothetical protein
MLSLPIPASNGLVSCDDLSAGNGQTYLETMRELRQGHEGRLVLSHKKWLASSEGIKAHFDPDLVAFALERLPGWRGMLGQATLDVCLNVALPEEGSLGECGVADAGKTSSESFKRSVIRCGLYIRVTS